MINDCHDIIIFFQASGNNPRFDNRYTTPTAMKTIPKRKFLE
jgi:hypothetical protein